MILGATIKQGIQEIWNHKFRSLLSMTGIILGVASLVAMIGVVEGMVKNFTVFFEETGGIEKVTIRPTDPPESQQHMAHLSPGLTLDDAETIRAAVPLAEYVSPETHTGWMGIGHEGNWTGMRLTGVTPGIEYIEKHEIEAGRFLGDLDNESASMVTVIGSVVKDRIYEPDEDPVGTTILARGKTLTVVGVLKEYYYDQGGRNALRWKNHVMFIPARTLAQRYEGSREVRQILVKVGDYRDLDDLVPQLRNTLLAAHNGIEDLEIRTSEDRLAEFEKLERSFTYSLGGVAAISLLVGGIGIMNVMLAVVSERIREIGVRKAVGARSGDIFLQFLVESTLISVIGGIIGVAVSSGFLSALSGIVPGGENIRLFPVAPMAFGFLFSAIVGVCSGLYPALKAARLDPIEALRYE